MSRRHFRTFLREAAATLFVAVLLFSALALGNI